MNYGGFSVNNLSAKIKPVAGANQEYYAVVALIPF